MLFVGLDHLEAKLSDQLIVRDFLLSCQLSLIEALSYGVVEKFEVVLFPFDLYDGVTLALQQVTQRGSARLPELVGRGSLHGDSGLDRVRGAEGTDAAIEFLDELLITQVARMHSGKLSVEALCHLLLIFPQ